MFYCSTWQWSRYKEKIELVKTYDNNRQTAAIPFPVDSTPEALEKLIDHKVTLSGSYDYDHELIVTNKQHAAGAGHHLITPLKIDNTDHYVLISRGFIPYEDATKESWQKYRLVQSETLSGVVKRSISSNIFKTMLGPWNPDNSTRFAEKWFFEEVDKIAKQLPYPIITSIYIQRLGTPPGGEIFHSSISGAESSIFMEPKRLNENMIKERFFPAEDITIDVPPSTHFGYTIEWSVLGTITLIIGFLLQAFRRPKRALSQTAPIILASIFLCSSLAHALSDPEQAPTVGGVQQKLGEQVDLNLIMKDSSGQEVPLKSLTKQNRPIVIAPVYYSCPRLCGLTMNGIVDVLNKTDLKLGEDYTVINYSFNSKEDSKDASEKQDKYLAKLSSNSPTAKDGWHFLTSNEETIRKLSDQIGFSYQEDNGEFIHAATLVILDPSGKISRYFPGIEYNPQEFRLALVDASEGRIGSFSEQVFLFCFRYDHLKGQYSFAVWNIMRVTCILITLAVAGLLIFLRTREIKDGR
jgi:protein SCO1/2